MHTVMVIYHYTEILINDWMHNQERASQEFNDYDYCLPHLLDQDEEYKQYFLDAKKQGRYIVMDNSLHELGESYQWDRLKHWLYELDRGGWWARIDHLNITLHVIRSGRAVGSNQSFELITRQ